MSNEVQKCENISIDVLLEKVRALNQQGFRLVQIGATALPSMLELTYSFDLKGELQSLRLMVPIHDARVPSISSIYWCAFIYENELHDLFNIAVEGIAVDFHGKFYNTAVKFPFGTSTSPAPAPKTNPASPSPAAPNAKPAPAPNPKPAAAAAS